jgi:hypothetical protein
MKLTALVCCALISAACAREDNAKAREEAHQTAEQLRHDSRVALNEAEIDAKKAGKVINRDLEKAREKVRESIDEHEHTGTTEDKDRP